MSWDTVPWFVGGGAQHSPETARLLGYVALNGNEGILGAADLQVKQLGTPGASVTVGTGAVSILNRASGGTYQAYVGRMPTQDTIAVAATGAGGGRSDLIVARVEDPFLAGEPWADPTDVTVGPYIFTRVISNVSSTATAMPAGMSGIVLARIDLPANTTAITQAMIKDLRKVANPRRERQMLVKNPTTTSTTTSTTFVQWPPEATWTVNVPSWATGAVVRAIVGGIKVLAGSVDTFGEIRLLLGTVASQAITFDETRPALTYDRKTWSVADTLVVPSAMRGTAQTLSLQAHRNGTANAGTADIGSSISVDIEFTETAS